MLLANEARQREKHAEKIRATARERSARYYRKVMNDPKMHAAMLERRRMQYRLNKEKKRGSSVPTRTVRTKYSTNSTQERLPAKPLQDWILHKIEKYGSLAELARACEVDERRFNAVLNERSQVTFSTVDEMLTNEGTTNIWDLYESEYEQLLSAAA